jgi:hypothetical protein
MKSVVVRGVVSAGLVVLLLGFSFAPLVVSVRGNSSYVCTVEACGGVGGQRRVQLTVDQCHEVEQAFEAYRSRLSGSVTREETLEALSCLLGVLRLTGVVSGLGCAEIYRHVAGLDMSSRLIQVSNDMVLENAHCLVVGRGSDVMFSGALQSRVHTFLLEHFEGSDVIGRILFYSFLYSLVRLKCVGGDLGFGVDFGISGGPSVGWISTVGAQGKFSVKGMYYGLLDDSMIFGYHAASGFTGVRFFVPGMNWFYLGYASEVKIGYNATSPS